MLSLGRTRRLLSSSTNMRLNNSFIFLAITGTSAWAPTGRAGNAKRPLHTTNHNNRPFADVTHSRRIRKLHGTMPPLTVGEEYLPLARDMMSFIGESTMGNNSWGTRGKTKNQRQFVIRSSTPPSVHSQSILPFYKRVTVAANETGTKFTRSPHLTLTMNRCQIPVPIPTTS